jgi:hypothetical protein
MENNDIFIDIISERFPNVIDSTIFDEKRPTDSSSVRTKSELDRILKLSFIISDEDGHPKGPVTIEHVRRAIQMVHPHVIFYEKMNF